VAHTRASDGSSRQTPAVAVRPKVISPLATLFTRSGIEVALVSVEA
jgi:hypothetical protein